MRQQTVVGIFISALFTFACSDTTFDQKTLATDLQIISSIHISSKRSAVQLDQCTAISVALRDKDNKAWSAPKDSSININKIESADDKTPDAPRAEVSMHADSECSKALTLAKDTQWTLPLKKGESTPKFYVRGASNEKQAATLITLSGDFSINAETTPIKSNAFKLLVSDTAPLYEPLVVAPQKDASVNSSLTWKGMSEVLERTFSTTGGAGNTQYKVTATPSLSNLKVSGDKLTFRPGLNTDSGYQPQIGEYTIQVTATDNEASTKDVTVSFKLSVKPITYERSESRLKITDDNDLEETFSVIEYLHPNRLYKPNLSDSKAKYVSSTCLSFKDPSTSITLGKSISVTALPVQKKSDGANVHDIQVFIPGPSGTAPFDELVFVYNILLEPTPKTTISSSQDAPTIELLFGNARCLNSENEANGDCVKRAIKNHGIDNFYYCSDWFRTSDKKKELKGKYCAMSRAAGTNDPSCQ